MNEDFAPFELAVKLKERGFNCMYPIAMYNEGGVFHELYTSVGNMQYYDYDDFDERDTIAPTISQVLKWLKNTYNLHVETYPCGLGMWKFLVTNITTLEERALCDKYMSSEQAAVAGIEYVLDNLI